MQNFRLPPPFLPLVRGLEAPSLGFCRRAKCRGRGESLFLIIYQLHVGNLLLELTHLLFLQYTLVLNRSHLDEILDVAIPVVEHTTSESRTGVKVVLTNEFGGSLRFGGLVTTGGSGRLAESFDEDLDREDRLVGLAGRVQQLVDWMPRRLHRLRANLQLALRVSAPLVLRGVGVERKRLEDRLRRGEAAVQIRRADDRLDRIRERLRVPRQFRRALVAPQTCRKTQPLRRLAKRRGGHHMRPAHGERTLLLLRELRIQTLRAQHPENRIPEELEPLVVLRARHVHPVRRRRQRLLQKRLVLKRISEYLHDGDYTTSEPIGERQARSMRDSAIGAVVMKGRVVLSVVRLRLLAVHENHAVRHGDLQRRPAVPAKAPGQHMPIRRRQHRRLLVAAAVVLVDVRHDRRPILRKVPARSKTDAPRVVPVQDARHVLSAQVEVQRPDGRPLGPGNHAAQMPVIRDVPVKAARNGLRQLEVRPRRHPPVAAQLRRLLRVALAGNILNIFLALILVVLYLMHYSNPGK